MQRWSMYVPRRALFFLTLIAVMLVAGLDLASPHLAAAKSVTWRNYDVTLTLNGDGTFHVVERQVVDFEGGPFSYAFADIPLTRVEDITNISVSEEQGGSLVTYDQSTSQDPETFTVKRSSSSITINWYMPNTQNQERVFNLAYDVIGGLRVYQDASGQRQQIWWTAIGSEVTQTAPVDSGTFTIKLPQAVSTNEVVLDGPGSTIPTDHTQDGRVWTWSVANMSSGDSLTARLEFPALVNATAPAWQQADDAQRIREQDRASRDALLKLLLAGAALLTLTAGGVGLFGLWYTRGRDPGVGAVASYLSEPPDDLPPGAAGALVDEEVNERDIVATLVDLGRRGVLNIQEEEEGSAFKRREYTIALKQDAKDLRPFEQTFVTSIMSGTDAGKTVTLGDAKERFSRKVETIRSQMYDELVKRGYFTVSPQTTRKRYQSFASVAIVALIIAAAIFGGAILDISGWFIVPAIAILVILFALYQTARYMPRKTVAGAESAAKWRAFKRYLEDIDQQKVGDNAAGIFEKYLPYAVAFGLERTWVSRFAQAGAPAPDWYGGFGGYGGGWFDPEVGRRSRRRTVWVGGPGWGGVPTATGEPRAGDGGGVDLPGLPDIQSASDKGAKSLESVRKWRSVGGTPECECSGGSSKRRVYP